MLMRNVIQYFGPNGEKLEELTLCDVESGKEATAEQLKELTEPEPITVYLGVMIIPVAIQGADGRAIGVRPQEMRFPIDATSRKQAFENYQAAVDAAIKQLKADQEQRAKEAQAAQSKLVIANSAETEAISKMRLVTE